MKHPVVIVGAAGGVGNAQTAAIAITHKMEACAVEIAQVNEAFDNSTVMAIKMNEGLRELQNMKYYEPTGSKFHK